MLLSGGTGAPGPCISPPQPCRSPMQALPNLKGRLCWEKGMEKECQTGQEDPRGPYSGSVYLMPPAGKP